MHRWFVFVLMTAALTTNGYAADIEWITDLLDEESDVSNFGTAVEAAAFTGERDNNAIAGTFPLDEAFDVNGTTFQPYNFTFLDSVPEFLTGMTYNNGEFGHTEEEDGLGALLAGVGFESGVGTQFYELDNLTVGQGYQVEFYYYHNTVDRSVTLEDDNGNAVTVFDGGNAGIGGFASGYFVADGTSQEIIATGSEGSQYINGYQLRAVSERPPIFDRPVDPVDPPSPPALIGYWNFDNSTDDLSGNNNHGTISGGVDYDSDVPAALGEGTSASFDGFEGSHVEIEHNSMMPATSHPSFTISMWVKGDGTIDNVDDRVFSEGSSTNNNPLFNIGTKNDGADATLDFFYRNGGSTGHVFSEGDVFDEEWRHIVWVDEDNVGTLYIDGEEDSTFDYSGLPSFDADITSIGSVLRAADCCNFTGNIDDVAIYSFALDDEAIAALASGESPLSIPIPGGLPGDFNNNGVYDAEDIDLLSVAVKDGMDPPEFDLTNDGLVNQDDRVEWVTGFANTYFGDADLNGEFDSSDFVVVFTAGKYEIDEMAGWAEGDWDGDMRFTSSDFVAAFGDGGYEAGPRPAVAAVPEPSTAGLALIAILGFALRRRVRAKG